MAVSSVLSVVSLLWSLRSNSWSHWWSSEEFFVFFFVLHWWSLTSLVSSTLVSSTLVFSTLVSATVLWFTIVVSSVSSSLHVLNKLSPEGFWLLFLIIFVFFLNLNEFVSGRKWITGEHSWWESGSIGERVTHWLDGTSIAPRATSRFARCRLTRLFTGFLWSFSEFSEGSWESVESLRHSVELIKSLVHHLFSLVDESLFFLMMSIMRESKVRALEYSSWKSLGII